MSDTNEYPPKGTACRDWTSNRPYYHPGQEAVEARARELGVSTYRALESLKREQWARRDQKLREEWELW